ncbi:hypothetical protein ACI01nite_17410 [Acetobacter cibinongensis]|uniref:Uncharacterized protein n=1 Tax=Acetobacter cibinongensis TaxID=146475 RepID=A0A1Z5YT17_9PROT|nr:hypothetical protein HK14_09525 [Acetobacter cibinongensis]GAN59616.1 hypothetical protein Abci_007_019 [Acetobacter cibinongensis]GBQ15413.1 hypothetical protein AA0482_1230 [Acetobacter cibinongensis NRIC 0482]GEL59139.1 hypothetical protein ACI01nite_17410 [Acetobacter cibinongensis]
MSGHWGARSGKAGTDGNAASQETCHHAELQTEWANRGVLADRVAGKAGCGSASGLWRGHCRGNALYHKVVFYHVA